MTKRKKRQSLQKRRRPWFLFAVAGLGLLLIGGFILFYNPTTATAITVNAEPVSAEQIALGKEVYNANCASCHGPTGEGQPNWKQPDEKGALPAPPHDSSGHTWHHADGQLLQIIAQGGSMPGSAMPAYTETLTEAEIVAVLAYIKTFWGSEEMEFQTEVTNQNVRFN